MQNPFMRSLRSSFENLYRRAAERGEATTIIAPCADCIEGEISQNFAEAHILQAAVVPGCHMNMLGQGVEIKDNSVSTHLGFQEHRTCEVRQSESMYDFSNTFRVLVTDKPLCGRYRIIQGAVDRGGPKAPGNNTGAVGPADAQCDWLNTAPAIQDDFVDQVDRFRKTFVQVPGCEQSTAERIREIVGDAKKRLMRHHRLQQPNHQKQLDYQVSRHAYAFLHSFVFPHLQRILAPAEERLQKAIRSYATAAELVAAIPDAAGRGLATVDVRRCSEALELMDHKITPHEKITCIDEAHSMLQRGVEDGARADGAGQQGAIEITGDDVLSLFILALHGTTMEHYLAHIAHVEMYSQGEAERFEAAGYAVSALQAALQFFLEERRHVSSTRGPSRPATNIFSSYLQPGGDQGMGLGGSGFGGANPGAGAGEDDLQGLVRQARVQGQRR